MTYYELSRDIFGIVDPRELKPGEIVVGQVNKGATTREVIDDVTMVGPGPEYLMGTQAAVVFDKPHWWSVRKAVVYLDRNNAEKFDFERAFAEGYNAWGTYAEAADKAWRLALEQSGAKTRRQRRP